MAGALVDQDSHRARRSQKGNGSFEPLFATEGLHAQSAPVSIDQLIEMWVAQRLVNSSEPRLRTSEGGLSIEFPIAHVGDREDHSSAVENIPLDSLAIFERGNPQDGFGGKRSNLECTDAIRAEGDKMAKGQAAELRAGQIRKCGGEIFPCEFAVARQDRPERGAKHLAKQKADRKRKMTDHSNGAQRKPVSQPIQHAEKSAQT